MFEPVAVPVILLPVTVPLAATLVGVIAPNPIDILGVVVGVATEAVTPLEPVAETDVTDPAPGNAAQDVFAPSVISTSPACVA